MDFKDLDHALLQGFEAFTQYIEKQLQDDEALLRKTFWNQGKMVDFLTYVIEKHDPDTNNLTGHVQYLLEKGANTTLNQPVHLVLKDKKLDLLPCLLEAQDKLQNKPKQAQKEKEVELIVDDNADVQTHSHFINGRDCDGRTILSRAVETGNIECLQRILRYRPLIDQADNIRLEEKIDRQMQPLHLAAFRDFGEGVKALLQAGANVDNPFGSRKRPALSIAAREIHVSALEALLEFAHKPEQLNYNDTLGSRPIDLLCDSLAKNTKTHEAIRGIAMLLCRGADMPRKEKDCQLLQTHRQELLNEILSYAGKNPELKPAILRTIHNKNHALHRVIYDTHSLSRSFKNLAGGYDELAGQIESLAENIPADAPVQLKEDEKKFAEFVKLYLKNIKDARFFNRWSGMLTKISEGEVTCWQQLHDYAYANPNSRTALVIKQMENTSHSVHVNLELVS
ncbi:ankyrin repeat domain-containing protein [Legionella erythra]|uniref:Ankyrin repeat-containing protein n=1 Tax=Legionella erythra TaxID=448 RepID=A0A0W0TS88_LEGER|nr:ankyrin repeat domain-containing protein [Legionella erythra]KTC98261.1 ankyrin repeat-containing protein [Legionella erythra]